MGVLVVLEMDGDTDAVMRAAEDLEARRPTDAIAARVIAPTETGVIVVTHWRSAEAREAYQADPAHKEALQASGLLDAVEAMRSSVYDGAELQVRAAAGEEQAA